LRLLLWLFVLLLLLCMLLGFWLRQLLGCSLNKPPEARHAQRSSQAQGM
jgi:hypothetical protein